MPRATAPICQCRCDIYHPCQCDIHRTAQDEARTRAEPMTACGTTPLGVISYRLPETRTTKTGKRRTGEPVLRTRHLLVLRTHHICVLCCDWWRTQRPDMVAAHAYSPALEEGLAVARRVSDLLDRDDQAPHERAAAALDVLLDGVPKVTRLDPHAFDFVALAEAIQTRPTKATVRAWAAKYGLILPEPGPATTSR
ncbi:MAG: hypothetical protein QOH97_5381 [Actinoplanes sp.]|jgi:hypothetical protein|nr:hypothetical protein [Actinoplanes sp.]